MQDLQLAARWRDSLEWFTLKTRSFSAQLRSALLLGAITLVLTACANKIYYNPQYNYTGRPTPPSGLLQRVLVAYTANGSSGGLEILDGYRDLRSNVQNTVPSYHIAGYSGAEPVNIINFPEEQRGYVLSYTDGSLGNVNYSTEASSGSVSSFGAESPSAAAAPSGTIFAGASNSGQLVVTGGSGTIPLSLPNVDKVAISQGADIILAMTRNSNTLYRVVVLPASNNPVPPPGAVDCEPILLPLYCVVPVGGAYDRPVNASFSLDGSSVYILNCGPECGGTTAGVTVLQAGALNINNIPTVNPLSAGAPSPLATLPVANPVRIPGGVTAALSDGSTLYLSGQSLQAGGLFGGNLTLLNLTTYVPGSPIAISDGSHNRMLFADNNTLWIGSQQCANGVRAARAATELQTQGFTDQAGNYNCLTMVTLGSATPTAQIIPAVVQSTGTTTAVTVGYPNTDQNLYYYGSLNGICWVETYGKVYTAYGGQVHAFNTSDGSERNNTNITVQGNVLDVAYMDASTNSTN